ncbi:MAG: AAA family ATPase, partial [Betaproteobacteria bacterium]
MLVSLSVQQFVIVEQLDLDFSQGFTVMTGETGAGKSILIDALDLLLGGRGDATVVREKAAKADLSARFDLSDAPEAQAWLAEAE